MLIIVIFISSFLIGIGYQHYFGADTAEPLTPPGKRNWLDVRNSLYKLISWYLLVRIGVTGGTEIALHGSSTILITGSLAIGLSVLMFCLSLSMIYFSRSFDRETRISLAAHLGSVSIGTFFSALALLNELGIAFRPEANAWVAIMELPAVSIAVICLSRGTSVLKHLLKNDKRMLALPLALVSSICFGPWLTELAPIHFAFDSAFNFILAYFLFEMGRHAYDNLANLGTGKVRRDLILIGIGLPVLGGTIGTAIAQYFSLIAGLGVGDAMLLGTLAASGSYVAAPSILQPALDAVYGQTTQKGKRVVATSLTVVLGITLPFNILVGIQLYLFEAKLFSANPFQVWIGLLVVASFVGLASLACWLWQTYHKKTVESLDSSASAVLR